ncbi:MAG: hypothetical protein ACREO8_04330 [Luteimonas sp.]
MKALFTRLPWGAHPTTRLAMNRRDAMKWSALGLAAQALPAHAASRAASAAAQRLLLPWRHADETLRLAVTRQPGVGDAVSFLREGARG